MRRLGSILLVLALCLGFVPFGGVSSAQEAPVAQLRLLSQSAWNGPDRPLKLRFEATNISEAALGDLSVVLTIFAPPVSRTAYSASLTGDATSPIFVYPFLQPGVLLPGQTREYQIKQALDIPTSRGVTAIYPLKVELRSQDVPAAVLRTPMIFLQAPVTANLRLNLEWTFALAARIQFAPGGTFLPGTLESQIAPGGGLDVAAQVLAQVATKGVPVDLALSASLAEQLLRMERGYRIQQPNGKTVVVAQGTGGAADAHLVLEALRAASAARTTEVVATTGGDATVPSLVRSGLVGTLPDLLRQGGDLVERSVGKPAAADILRPPQSQLDAGSVSTLFELGYRTVLVDPGYVEPGADITFSPPPTVRLTTGAASLVAVAPDDRAADTMAAYPGDPRLAAQATLGELAARWLEFPGTSGRGAAILFPDSPSFDAAILPSLASLVMASPWLRPVTASYLTAFVPPTGDQGVPAHRYPAFPGAYVGAYRQADASLGRFERTVVDEDVLVDGLHNDLRLSLSGSFVRHRDQPEGLRFIDAVDRTIATAYGKVSVDDVPITLASRGGVSIPVTIRNDSGFAMSVEIRLVADRRLTFVQGASQTAVLDTGSRTFTFPVRAETTGRFPIKIQVLTRAPLGAAETIAEAQVVVRSTAYNRVALFLTIGAGAFLFAWWGRRYLPRKKS
jgi:hypothetical protein